VQGVTEFIITLGYKAEIIKEYFLNFYAINNDLTVDLATGEAIVHGNNQLPWTVHLIDTGLHTQTGGRLKRVERCLDDDETFMFTTGMASLTRYRGSGVPPL
jgi:glucose-1-phosphate cytidylyltransferase